MPKLTAKKGVLVLVTHALVWALPLKGAANNHTYRSPVPGRRHAVPQKTVAAGKPPRLTVGKSAPIVARPPEERPGHGTESAADGPFFRVAEMPNGSEVTLPPSSAILVAAGMRAKVAPTNSGQLMKLGVGPGANPTAARSVAIFDQNQDKVRHVVVQPGQPTIYAFSGLGAVVVHPEGSQANGDAGVMIDSLYAITVGR